MAKRGTYTPEFKAKVVKELVEGTDSVSVVASRYNLNTNMVSGWRKQVFDNMETIFSQDKAIAEKKAAQSEHEKEVDNLNRIIGQLTVERDYLQRGVQERLRAKEI